MLVADPDPAVEDGQAQFAGPINLRLVMRDGQAHPALLGELDGVAQQVQHDLLQSDRVADDDRRQGAFHFEFELDALALSPWTHQRRHLGHQLCRRERDVLGTHFARLDLGEVQNVVDHPHQVFTIAMDRMDVVLSVLLAQRVVLEKVCEPEDRVHRRADLMAHVGEEITLSLVGGLGLFLGRTERGNIGLTLSFEREQLLGHVVE